MQIVPGQRVQLTYLVPNFADETLYYPQAVVKNTQTGAVVATVNLTQDANQHIRYTGSFVAPADSIGLGYFMDSVCIPYTDSGYSMPSALYGAALTEFFAYQLPSTFSGGGGSDVIFDYKKMEEILDGKFGALKFPESQKFEMPEFPEIPEYKETDLAPVMSLLSRLADAIAAVDSRVSALPPPEKVDLQPLHTKIGGLAVDVRHHLSEHKKVIDERLAESEKSMEKRHKDHVKEMTENIGEKLEGFGSNGIPITFMSYQKSEGNKPPSQREIYDRLKGRDKAS